ncbi:MAG TPA: YchF-related putative GTPase [Nitrososphaerales archaeon]|nr:YchF-related putative GTPase [Nitrososphaerales archaeon]
MPIRIGLIGKTNAGKTTLFNSMTLLSGEVSNYPFTTKAPETGVASVVTPCVHKEFRVQDNPVNSKCEDSWRFVPVDITDLPGLIKGAWMGKGLGNQFLSVAAQSDALLHVVDASGSVDKDGKISEPGTGDPIADFADVELELVLWYMKLLMSNIAKISKLSKTPGYGVPSAVEETLHGIGVRKEHVISAMNEALLTDKEFDSWSEKEIQNFCWVLRDVSKPTLVIANKMDLPFAAENFRRLREKYKGLIVVPTSGEAELTLRRAESKGLIRYVPGEERFEILRPQDLNEAQKSALAYIRRKVFGEYLRTGVQFGLNIAVFKLLKMNAIYPVADAEKLTDKDGRVLPDVYLLPNGSTVEELAGLIHTELSKGLVYAVDARTGIHLPTNYVLRDRDVLSIVSTARRS